MLYNVLGTKEKKDTNWTVNALNIPELCEIILDICCSYIHKRMAFVYFYISSGLYV